VRTDPDKRSCRARLQARLAAAHAAGRARLRAERGSVLVEVMVGAVVLAIATLAILNGIDGAESAGAKNKARSVQASIAQQYIERMRSMPLSELNGLRRGPDTVNVAGVDYSVVWRTDWVSDKLGVINCNSTSAQAEYLKLTSTVTSPITGSKPQTQTGLLTPGTGQLSNTNGTATVQLSDRDGNAAAGVGVGLSGASTQSATTNALGCAVFGYIPAGSYTITVNGRVTIDSEPATDAITVYAGRASYNAMQVAIPAKVRASFTQPVGQTFTTSMLWDQITVKNGNLLGVGGTKIFTSTTGRNATVDGAGLYPYLDGVGVYAGSCAANDPEAYKANYFVPGAPRGYTALNPGDNPRTVSVEMPTLRVLVTREPVGTPTATVPSWFRTQLRVTSLDTGCVSPLYEVQPTDRATNLNTPVQFDLALPFGKYRICAATRGRTSGTTGTATPAATTIDRRYTTTTTAGTSPVNPADQALTTVPAPANKQITITTPGTATTANPASLCY
jgi:Tfp pilus assembly protein PilV